MKTQRLIVTENQKNPRPEGRGLSVSPHAESAEFAEPAGCVFSRRNRRIRRILPDANLSSLRASQSSAYSACQ